ncbi:MAG: replicative DNA helicase [Spirochaetales bacterium]|nr:replicative DNA helicase [Spirochaetales bacterium]
MVPASLKDKVPPHNDEAEKATLGALLLDSESLGTVLGFLRADDFYKSAHGKIFQAIIDLFNDGEPIDLITITERLRTEGNLSSCGGAGYISTLTSVVPTSANVEYYSKIVQDASVRRILSRTANEMIASAHDDTMESREIIEEAERKIFEITDKQQTAKYKCANEIVRATVESIEKLYHNKDSYTGVPSGYPDLDTYTNGFQKSEFIVIGARPSVGKTAFALSMAANIAVKKKRSLAFFTLEMSDQALMQRLLASEARIRSESLRSGMLRPSDFSALTEAAGRIYEAPLYIDDTPNMKLLDLRAQARRMKSRENVEIIMIDYIGLIAPESKSNVPRHEQVAEISRSLKALARELEIPIVCLSQVGRQSEGKAPTLADLRESGSIEQDADVVMFLHREREQDASNIETQLIIAKQRNGPIGTVNLAFIPQYTRFESISRNSS